jgi:hypothetical protein
MPISNVRGAALIALPALLLAGCTGDGSPTEAVVPTSAFPNSGYANKDGTQPVKVALKPGEQPPGAASPENYAGKWQITDGRSGKTCIVTLDKSESKGVLKASSSGCKTKELGKIVGWKLNNNEVVLTKKGGESIAQLRASSPNLLDGGLTAAGEFITMWR